MIESLRSKGNNDYITDLFVKFEKTIRDGLNAMQDQLDQVKHEVKSINQDIPSWRQQKRARPSTSSLPTFPQPNQASVQETRPGLPPKFKLDVPIFNGTDLEGRAFKINQFLQ